MVISKNAIKLLKEKNYFQKNETSWEDICKRVSKNIASAEESDEKAGFYEKLFFNMMKDMYFIPSTPCLLNAGTKVQQLSSCFILDIDDNIESIMQTLTECAKIFQKSGGAGFNISKLRPSGSPLSNSGGYASGPVSFMKLFNQLVEEVKHGNSRKGALKIDLDASHPDIFDFIHCKNSNSQLENMNISVSILDQFMHMVKNNGNWDLTFNNKLYDSVNARNLFYEIIENAWKTGDPGLSFKGVMNRENMNPHLGKIEGTNPCLCKDTYMITENGLEKISRLKSKIWNGKEYCQSRSWFTGIKPTIKLITNSGFEYIVTKDHKIKLDNGEWCEAINMLGKNIKFDLSGKEWIGYNPYPDCDYRVLGFELGDGGYHKASKRMKSIYVSQNNDYEVKSIIENTFNKKFNYLNNKNQIEIPYNSVYANAFSNKIEFRDIPDWIMTLPKKEMKDFLQGLFSANGSNLIKYNRIQLVSINKEMLQKVQQMLLLMGIKAKLWYHNKEKQVKFSNGIYNCKQSYHLVISRNSYKKFMNKIGFIQSYKNKINNINFKNELEYEKVILIKEMGEKEVWDFSEPNLHQGITNGAYVHNCNEFVNIAYSSCNLGSINLSKLVENEDLNLEKVEHYVRLGVRFLDNMISVNKLPLPKIQQVTEDIRPIGLGTMGLAEMLFKLKIPMNSNDCYTLLNNLYFLIKKWAKEESMLIAKEKGVYSKWEGSVWQQNNIKIRNSNLISIAPNGCQKPETLILTDNGIFRLSELVDINGKKWQNLNNVLVSQEDSYKKAEKGYINGYVKTKKILLNSGIELESTYNHQYRVIRNNQYLWIKAKDIVEGDIIPVKIGGYNNKDEYKLKKLNKYNMYSYNNIEFIPTFPDKLNSELAFLLGAYFANGSNHGNSIRISMNAKKIDDINKLNKIIYKLFGYNAKNHQENSNKTCHVIYINSKKIIQWLKANNLIKSKNCKNGIPLPIRCSSVSALKSFIDGYYMCDGSKTRDVMYIDTTSYQMAQDLAICLRTLGQNIRIHCYKDRSKSMGNKPLYRIYYIKSGSIGFQDYRYIRKDTRNRFNNVKNIVGNNFIADKVVSVTNGENMTLDLFVPQNNCYIANNVVSHNTIAFLADVTGGIEPVFALVYTRTTGDGNKYKVFNPVFEQELEKYKLNKESIIEQIIENNGSIQNIKDIPEEIRKVFVTAIDLTPDEHLNYLDIISNYVDLSVSKTINLPNYATIEDVANIYMKAWEKKNIKGITVYRDGSKNNQILSVSDNNNNKKIELERGEISVAPEISTHSKTVRIKTGCGNAYITMTKDENKNIDQTFINRGSKGTCVANQIAVSRLISLSLRGGISIDDVVDQLLSVPPCPTYYARKCNGEEVSKGSSCPSAIGYQLEEYAEEKLNNKKNNKKNNNNKTENPHSKCPDCQELLIYESGCISCVSCGFSKCN